MRGASPERGAATDPKQVVAETAAAKKEADSARNAAARRLAKLALMT
ncbi:hypothetical protein AB0M46_09325 [Dactylosporangium sp. NPDC051485]